MHGCREEDDQWRTLRGFGRRTRGLGEREGGSLSFSAAISDLRDFQLLDLEELN